MRRAGRLEFLAGRMFDHAGQRDPRTGQRVGVRTRGDDGQAGPRIAGQITAVLSQLRYAQDRCAIQQSIGDERRPRVTTVGASPGSP